MTGSYPRTRAIRDERRARAEALQAANVRTPQEQLANLDRQGLVAARERLKLAAKIRKLEESLAAEAKKTSKKKDK